MVCSAFHCSPSRSPFSIRLSQHFFVRKKDEQIPVAHFPWLSLSFDCLLDVFGFLGEVQKLKASVIPWDRNYKATKWKLAIAEVSMEILSSGLLTALSTNFDLDHNSFPNSRAFLFILFINNEIEFLNEFT